MCGNGLSSCGAFEGLSALEPTEFRNHPINETMKLVVSIGRVWTLKGPDGSGFSLKLWPRKERRFFAFPPQKQGIQRESPRG